MYSNVHGIVGAGIVLAVQAVSKDQTVALTVGGFLAFISHDVLDRLGEYSYGSKKQTLIYEVVPWIIFLALAYVSGYFWLYFTGYVAGNIMDLVDKKMYLSVFNPKKYPSTAYFKCHRRRPNIQLTRQQTIDVMYICNAILLFVTIYIYFKVK